MSHYLFFAVGALSIENILDNTVHARLDKFGTFHLVLAAVPSDIDPSLELLPIVSVEEESNEKRERRENVNVKEQESENELFKKKKKK